MDCDRLPPVPQGSAGLDPLVHHLAADCRDAVAYPCGRAIHFHPAFAGIFSRTDDWMQKLWKKAGKLEFSHLLAGFRNTTTPLITIGGIYLVGQVLIFGVCMLVGGETMRDLLMDGKRVDENELTGCHEQQLVRLCWWRLRCPFR